MSIASASSASLLLGHRGPASLKVNQPLSSCFLERRRDKVPHKRAGFGVVRCSSSNGIGIGDFIGGDLLRPDIGKWLSDVEEHKALAIYSPHEGGYEGRYFTRLRYQGYYFLDLSARGLGDPETTLTKIHPVCPVSYYISSSICITLPLLLQLLFCHFFKVQDYFESNEELR